MAFWPDENSLTTNAMQISIKVSSGGYDESVVVVRDHSDLTFTKFL